MILRLALNVHVTMLVTQAVMSESLWQAFPMVYEEPNRQGRHGPKDTEDSFSTQAVSSKS